MFQFSWAQSKKSARTTHKKSIANEVARDQFCETTIGSANALDGAVFKKLFHTPTFRVSVVTDVAGVELCGALKNVVAIAAGLVDGLGYQLIVFTHSTA